jgi:hypothetical protein
LHASSTPTFAANPAIASHSDYAAHTAGAVIPNGFAVDIDASNTAVSTISTISAVTTCNFATEIPHASDSTADREITYFLAYGALS